MIGDLPEAEVKPPSNMLFVCKLNPVTTEEDLDIIFSRCIYSWVVSTFLVACILGLHACNTPGALVAPWLSAMVVVLVLFVVVGQQG